MSEFEEGSRPTRLSTRFTRDPLISKVVHPIVALSLFAHLSISEPTLSAVLGEPKFVITESSGGDPQLTEIADFGTWSDDQRFSKLTDAIVHEAVADGVWHTAQAMFAAEYEMEPAGISDWIEHLLASGRPSIAADAIRLAGRAEAMSIEDRIWLARLGLASASLEVRDAAMQAIEGWGDRPLVNLLKDHGERDQFLADYAARIIRDIEG